MRLVKEIEGHATIRASLNDDGEFTVRLRGRTIYDEPTNAWAGAEVPVPPELAAAVNIALQAVLDDGLDQLAHQLDHNAALAREIGIKMGEVEV